MRFFAIFMIILAVYAIFGGSSSRESKSSGTAFGVNIPSTGGSGSGGGGGGSSQRAPEAPREAVNRPRAQGAAPTDLARQSGAALTPERHTNNVLVVSWLPGYCRTHNGRPQCASSILSGDAGTHFSFDSLWPRPESDLTWCNVRNRRLESNTAFPALQLSPALASRQARSMPSVRAAEDRREWNEHGTCYGPDAETWLTDGLNLLDQLNASSVRDAINAAVTRKVPNQEIRDAFDAAFGEGAGERVEVRCPGGVFVELRINIDGDIGATPSLGELMLAAPPRRAGCANATIRPGRGR
jgi:ribonuclease T2